MIEEDEDKFEFEDELLSMSNVPKIDMSALPIPNGYCHNCCEPLEPGKLFCDSDCRMDYKKHHFRLHGKFPAL